MNKYYSYGDAFYKKHEDPDYHVRKHYYFGYGMNTNNNGMANRCPDAKNIGAAVLPGYKFAFRGHADVELSFEDSVHGVLWEISDSDLESLDRLEGFPTYYLRQRAWVETEDGWCQAWVYMMNDQSYISTPSEGYYSMCYQGYRENGVDTTQLTEAREHASKSKLNEWDFPDQIVDATYTYKEIW